MTTQSALLLSAIKACELVNDGSVIRELNSILVAVSRCTVSDFWQSGFPGENRKFEPSVAALRTTRMLHLIWLTRDPESPEQFDEYREIQVGALAEGMHNMLLRYNFDQFTGRSRNGTILDWLDVLSAAVEVLPSLVGKELRGVSSSYSPRNYRRLLFFALEYDFDMPHGTVDHRRIEIHPTMQDLIRIFKTLHAAINAGRPFSDQIVIEPHQSHLADLPRRKRDIWDIIRSTVACSQRHELFDEGRLADLLMTLRKTFSAEYFTHTEASSLIIQALHILSRDISLNRPGRLPDEAPDEMVETLVSLHTGLGSLGLQEFTPYLLHAFYQPTWDIYARSMRIETVVMLLRTFSPSEFERYQEEGLCNVLKIVKIWLSSLARVNHPRIYDHRHFYRTHPRYYHPTPSLIFKPLDSPIWPALLQGIMPPAGTPLEDELQSVLVDVVTRLGETHYIAPTNPGTCPDWLKGAEGMPLNAYAFSRDLAMIASSFPLVLNEERAQDLMVQYFSDRSRGDLKMAAEQVSTLFAGVPREVCISSPLMNKVLEYFAGEWSDVTKLVKMKVVLVQSVGDEHKYSSSLLMLHSMLTCKRQICLPNADPARPAELYSLPSKPYLTAFLQVLQQCHSFLGGHPKFDELRDLVLGWKREMHNLLTGLKPCARAHNEGKTYTDDCLRESLKTLQEVQSKRNQFTGIVSELNNVPDMLLNSSYPPLALPTDDECSQTLMQIQAAWTSLCSIFCHEIKTQDSDAELQQGNILTCSMLTTANVETQSSLLAKLGSLGFVYAPERCGPVELRTYINQATHNLPMRNVIALGGVIQVWLHEAEVTDDNGDVLMTADAMLDIIAYFDSKPSALASFYLQEELRLDGEDTGEDAGQPLALSMFAGALQSAKEKVLELLDGSEVSYGDVKKAFEQVKRGVSTRDEINRLQRGFKLGDASDGADSVSKLEDIVVLVRLKQPMDDIVEACKQFEMPFDTDVDFLNLKKQVELMKNEDKMNETSMKDHLDMKHRLDKVLEDVDVSTLTLFGVLRNCAEVWTLIKVGVQDSSFAGDEGFNRLVELIGLLNNMLADAGADEEQGADLLAQLKPVAQIVSPLVEISMDRDKTFRELIRRLKRLQGNEDFKKAAEGGLEGRPFSELEVVRDGIDTIRALLEKSEGGIETITKKFDDHMQHGVFEMSLSARDGTNIFGLLDQHSGRITRDDELQAFILNLGFSREDQVNSLNYPSKQIRAAQQISQTPHGLELYRTAPHCSSSHRIATQRIHHNAPCRISTTLHALRSVSPSLTKPHPAPLAFRLHLSNPTSTHPHPCSFQNLAPLLQVGNKERISSFLEQYKLVRELFALYCQLQREGHPDYQTHDFPLNCQDDEEGIQMAGSLVRYHYQLLDTHREGVNTTRQECPQFLLFTAQQLLWCTAQLQDDEAYANAIAHAVSPLYKEWLPTSDLINAIVSVRTEGIKFAPLLRNLGISIADTLGIVHAADASLAERFYSLMPLRADADLQPGQISVPAKRERGIFFYETAGSAYSRYGASSMLPAIHAVYGNVLPQPFEVLTCTAITPEDDVRCFIQRVQNQATCQRVFCALDVNKLPTKSQEMLLRFILGASEFAQKISLHCVMQGSQALLQQTPWVTKKEIGQDLMPAATSTEQRAIDFYKRACFKNVGGKGCEWVLVKGRAGDGKTHFIRKRVSSLKGTATGAFTHVCISLNESFSLSETLSQLFSLPVDGSAQVAVEFRISLGEYRGDGLVDTKDMDEWKQLATKINQFFFELLVLGQVSDHETGRLFSLPHGCEWFIFIELPDVAGHFPNLDLAMVPDLVTALPILAIVPNVHVVEPDSPLDLDQRTVLVSKYLLAHEQGSINRYICRPRHDEIPEIWNGSCFPNDPATRGVSEGRCADLGFLNEDGQPAISYSHRDPPSEDECRRVLRDYMQRFLPRQGTGGETPCKAIQRAFIQYMHRRCAAMEWCVRTRENVSHPYVSGFLMDTMLNEVQIALDKDFAFKCGNQDQTHLFLIYEYAQLQKERTTCDLMLFSTAPTARLSQAQEEALAKAKELDGQFVSQMGQYGFKGEKIQKFNRFLTPETVFNRETLDKLLCRSLSINLPANVERLSLIDEKQFILTKDFLIKMLAINERRECGLPIIIEGETGVGKTRLVRMLSELWNFSDQQFVQPLAHVLAEETLELLQKWGCVTCARPTPTKRFFKVIVSQYIKQVLCDEADPMSIDEDTFVTSVEERMPGRWPQGAIYRDWGRRMLEALKQAHGEAANLVEGAASSSGGSDAVRGSFGNLGSRELGGEAEAGPPLTELAHVELPDDFEERVRVKAAEIEKQMREDCARMVGEHVIPRLTSAGALAANNGDHEPLKTSIADIIAAVKPADEIAEAFRCLCEHLQRAGDHVDVQGTTLLLKFATMLTNECERRPLLQVDQQAKQLVHRACEARTQPQVGKLVSLLTTMLDGHTLKTFYRLGVHAALTPVMIRDFFLADSEDSELPSIYKTAELLLSRATSIESKVQHVTVMLDEVNTTCCMGLFKEIVVDRSILGKPLPRNIVIICACNPARDAGARDVQREDAGSTEWALGHYQVKGLPTSMRLMMWNFGALSEQQEKDYVESRIETNRQTGAVLVERKDMKKIEPKLKRLTSSWNFGVADDPPITTPLFQVKHSDTFEAKKLGNLLTEAQKLIRSFAKAKAIERLNASNKEVMGEGYSEWLNLLTLERQRVATTILNEADLRSSAAVSQRDFQRAFTLHSYFYENIKRKERYGPPPTTVISLIAQAPTQPYSTLAPHSVALCTP